MLSTSSSSYGCGGATTIWFSTRANARRLSGTLRGFFASMTYGEKVRVLSCRLRRLRMILVVVLVAILTAVATPVAAQQGWTGIVTDLSNPILPTNAIGFSAIDCDASGNVTAIWTERAGDGIHTVVQTTRRSKETGIWSAPVEVFRTSADAGAVCGQLLLDDAGNATASCHADWQDERVTLVALRYTASTDSWAAEEMETAVGLLQPYLAMDGAGNTYAVWSSGSLRLRRHIASTNTWSPIVNLPYIGTVPRMVADPAGNLFVTWRSLLGIHAINGAHYEAATGRWSNIATIPVPTYSLGAADLALDSTGHVMLVWGQWTTSHTRSAIRASRYAPATGWGPVVDIASNPAEFSEPRVVTDDAGNALAAWLAWYGPGRSRIEATTYSAAAGTWGPPTALSPFSDAVSWPVVVDDDAGNATIAWLQIQGLLSVVRSVRYNKATAAFGTLVNAAPAHPYLPLAWLTSDKFGAATIVWQERTGKSVVVQSTRWEPTPGSPEIAWAAVVPGALRVHIVPPQDIEPPFFFTNYQYSLDDGATWIARAPPSTTSPLDLHGLPGGTTVVRVRAVNRAGAGVASAPYPVSLSPAPDPPANLTVTAIVGELVTLTWAEPTGVVPPQGYVLEGGRVPGEVLAMLPTAGTAPTFTFTAPTGVFYIRLRAFSGAAWSGPSNEVPIHVNVAVPPSAPANLLGLVNGSTIALSWMNTMSGGAADGLRLNVLGSWSGTLPLPLGETFMLTNVPPGSYTISVSAVNATGVSPPSNAVTLEFPGICSGEPSSPRNLVAFVIGRTIYLAWDAPSNGPAVSGYDVLVTGNYTGILNTVTRTLSGAAAPGIYWVSVVATNSCGASAPTPLRTVLVY